MVVSSSKRIAESVNSSHSRKLPLSEGGSRPGNPKGRIEVRFSGWERLWNKLSQPGTECRRLRW